MTISLGLCLLPCYPYMWIEVGWFDDLNAVFWVPYIVVYNDVESFILLIF
jgi:hypothetical protein